MKIVSEISVWGQFLIKTQIWNFRVAIFMVIWPILNWIGTLINKGTSDSSYLWLKTFKSVFCFSGFPKKACQGCHIFWSPGSRAVNKQTFFKFPMWASATWPTCPHGDFVTSQVRSYSVHVRYKTDEQHVNVAQYKPLLYFRISCWLAQWDEIDALVCARAVVPGSVSFLWQDRNNVDRKTNFDS